MSQAQYTAIGRTRLMDVNNLRESQLIEYLQSRPEWVRKGILRILANLA